MVTTIQLNENVKLELSRMKRSPSETFEDVIVSLINNNRDKEKESTSLKEGYLAWEKELIKINKDWETAERGWD